NGPLSHMVVSNGAVVTDADGAIGSLITASNSDAVVTGPGSLWLNRATLSVGSNAPNCRLVVTNGGEVLALGSVTVGAAFSSTATNSSIIVDGGVLRATNAAGNNVLDIEQGISEFNAGLIEADRLLLTNQGFLHLNAGQLITRGALITNGPFVV